MKVGVLTFFFSSHSPINWVFATCQGPGCDGASSVTALMPLVLSEMWKLETGLTLNIYNVSYKAHQSGVLSLSMSICCFGFCCGSSIGLSNPFYTLKITLSGSYCVDCISMIIEVFIKIRTYFLEQ